MRLPGRYRLALLAYPAGYRASRGPELAATLAEGDDERGRPSTHEALALAYRGLLLRARLLGTPDGLLTAAAATILLAMFGGFTWAERVYLHDGVAAVWGSAGPGLWPAYPLAVCAFMVVAAGPLHVFERRQRLRRTLVLASVLPVVSMIGPGELVHWAIRDLSSLPEFFAWRARILVSWGNWQPALELIAIGFATILVARRLLVRRRPSVRRRALGATLALLSAFTVAKTYARPDLPAEYAQSAFADLEAATFVAAAGLLLALAASVAGRRRGWDSNPRGT